MNQALLDKIESEQYRKDAAKFGVGALLTGVDVAGVSAYRQGIIDSKFKGLQGLLKARGIQTVDGYGTLTSPNTVQVGDTTITAKNVVLATGSYSKTIPGLDIGGRILTSEQAMTLDFVPQRAIVLGGGVIGVEFSSVWRSWGTEVTIIEGLPRLVPNEDESVSKQFERAFRKRGIEFKTGVRFQSATQDEHGVTVTLEGGETITGDVLLVAVGRGASTANCGFEEVGVLMDRGYVLTNERLQTNIPGVYAVGDIHGHVDQLDDLLKQIAADIINSSIRQALQSVFADALGSGGSGGLGGFGIGFYSDGYFPGVIYGGQD